MLARTLALIPLVCLLAPAQVKITEAPVVIPTYVAGPPDANPFFYTGRTYQGAKGLVYPYPMYDSLTDVKQAKTYTQVCLENEYTRVCVLPELGGRIFEAVDKTNGYNFFYKQSVIKPALIGMLGAWISGGVEWNIPHHHRASSFMPVLYRAEEGKDGSKTIHVGELELRDRLRWSVSLTLRPGSSVVEAQVTALNQTPVQNSLLYFANVAVHTNDNYQVVFPPATQFATQHAKREFARWPIADSVYNGIDFSKGVDVSQWKNHPGSISMFAWNEDDDWLAGYDHGKQAGTMHVADHHTVPGKKFFTWGNGPGGKLWDKILSDTDGPYLELMVGAWSDNQPDYSWLQPDETRTVKQYWYPFRAIGGAKNATREAALNLDVKDGKAKLGFHTTQAYKQVQAILFLGTKALWQKDVDIDPAHPLLAEVALPAGAKETDLRAVLQTGAAELVSYRPLALEKKPLPPPVVPPVAPAKMKTTEELYLAGLRLEQFHSPALEPDPYYEEALKRDPSDARANTALGILYVKRGRFSDAEKLLRRAAATVTANYTRPKDGDSLYYLGLALQYQGQWKEAEDWLQRASWCYGWRSASFTQIAEIHGRKGDLAGLLEYASQALTTNEWNTRALALKAFALMKLNRGREAAEVRRQLRAIDPLDPRGFSEPAELTTVSRRQPSEGLELVAQCVNAGLWREAEQMLERLPADVPMAHYYRGYLATLQGQKETALAHFKRGSALPIDYVFPFQIENIEPLKAAMAADAQDARAPYYLGLLLFDRQPDEAVKLWQKALAADPKLAIAHRNLAVAYSRQADGAAKAVAELEKAIALNPNDAMYLFELDRQYELMQAPMEKRLQVLESHRKTAEKRDDAMSRLVALEIMTGKVEDAIGVMQQRHFHLWEGGARFNLMDAWTDAHIARGKGKLAAKDFKGALADFERSIDYPENLEVTRSYRGGRAPESYYWMAVAQQGLGNAEAAKKAWRESAAQLIGNEEQPRASVDSGALLLYYQALSLAKLGEGARARSLFQALLDAANKALQGGSGTEFFAKFGEQRSPKARAAQVHYVAGLGHLGLGENAKARAEFAKAVELNPYLVEAKARMEESK